MTTAPGSEYVLGIPDDDALNKLIKKHNLSTIFEASQNDQFTCILHCRKALIFVYYNWELPSALLIALFQYLKMGYTMIRPWGSSYLALQNLVNEEDLPTLIKFFHDYLVKYRNDEDIFNRIMKQAFCSGILILDYEKSQYTKINLKLTHAQWATLTRWYGHQKFSVSLNEIEKFSLKVNEDGTFKNEEDEINFNFGEDETHPTNKILNDINKLGA